MEIQDQLSQAEVWFCGISRQMNPTANWWRYRYEGKLDGKKFTSPEAALIAAKQLTLFNLKNLDLVPELKEEEYDSINA